MLEKKKKKKEEEEATKPSIMNKKNAIHIFPMKKNISFNGSLVDSSLFELSSKKKDK